MFSNFAAYNLILTTMKRYFFVALLLLAAGIQTAQAQSMMVRTSDGRLVPFGVEEVDSVFFTDANYVGGHEYIDLGCPAAHFGPRAMWVQTLPKHTANSLHGARRRLRQSWMHTAGTLIPFAKAQ